MIYDGKGSVKMMESIKATKSPSKKEGYWAGVGRRFKMDWEYSKPTILGSLTGSIIISILLLLFVKYAFEDAFYDSLMFVVLVFIAYLAGNFIFKYMIPDKKYNDENIIVSRDSNLENPQLMAQKVIEEELKRNAINNVIKFGRR